MNQMTISDIVRRTGSIIKANYRKPYVWHVDKLKLGYIPIPKCASSSTRNHMAYHQKITSNLPEDISKSDLERLTKKSLSPGKVIELRETYHLFSFVRNPLSRLYSCYRDKVVKKARRRDRCSLSPYRIHFGMTFDEFVHRTLEIPDKYSDQHFRSASSFLFHQGELLVDYVGKFEQFSSDWEVLSSEFGLPAPERTRRISGPSVSLEDIPLSRSLLARVIERYANDLDTFDYRNELESMLS